MTWKVYLSLLSYFGICELRVDTVDGGVIHVGPVHWLSHLNKALQQPPRCDPHLGFTCKLVRLLLVSVSEMFCEA